MTCLTRRSARRYFRHCVHNKMVSYPAVLGRITVGYNTITKRSTRVYGLLSGGSSPKDIGQRRSEVSTCKLRVECGHGFVGSDRWQMQLKDAIERFSSNILTTRLTDLEAMPEYWTVEHA